MKTTPKGVVYAGLSFTLRESAERPTGALYFTTITAMGYAYTHTITFAIWPPSFEDVTNAGTALLEYVKASEARTAQMYPMHPPSLVVSIAVEVAGLEVARTRTAEGPRERRCAERPFAQRDCPRALHELQDAEGTS
ncbi:hypothetical protein [Deinococcus yavapaiensis]|uniref:hypothetical protein n=1 Tax=Deinococcus yavapaiensis TaxID=309889 RepID=UPI000DA23EC3|nr:hypothetical protein [Deinococcus yavapaiensis]